MTSLTQVIKSVGSKLVPFFKTVAIYFVVFLPYDKPSVLSAILKCLPIISLMIFVLLHGMSFGDEYRYSRRILFGLIFCCVGDALLIWPQYFEIGMVAFAIGHCFYISAFGMKPLNVPLGIIIMFLGILGLLYLKTGLYGILIPGVPIYSIMLMTMLWRATSRVQFFQDLWTWSKLCSCIGAIFFVLSDLLIGITRFKHPINHEQALIMGTYYIAQLGISLSVVDSKIRRRSTTD